MRRQKIFFPLLEHSKSETLLCMQLKSAFVVHETHIHKLHGYHNEHVESAFHDSVCLGALHNIQGSRVQLWATTDSRVACSQRSQSGQTVARKSEGSKWINHSFPIYFIAKTCLFAARFSLVLTTQFVWMVVMQNHRYSTVTTLQLVFIDSTVDNVKCAMFST